MPLAASGLHACYPTSARREAAKPLFTCPIRESGPILTAFLQMGARGLAVARESFTVSPQAEQGLLEPGPECEGVGGKRCTFQLQTGR